MIPKFCLVLIALVVAVMGGAVSIWADDDVTVVPAPAAAPAPTQQTGPADGPVIHIHKKKPLTPAVTASGSPVPPAHPSSTVVIVPLARYAQTAAAPTPVVIHQLAPPISTPIKVSTVSISVPVTTTTEVHSASLVVETGLPVAKYPGMGSAIQGVSTYIPTPAPMPVKTVTGTTTHQPLYASILPASVIPLTSSSAGSFSTANTSRTTTPAADFVFSDFTSHKNKNFYPWKTGIITTMFYIGEGGSSISSTDNKASSWDEQWVSSNHGNDNPNDRNGFASANHASTVNPFYVALPFNDLAFPDKAREYVYRNWRRPREDGKEVSACKDRWIWIKSSSGRSCFAQWEDVGPLRYDHAEYVFGDERPDTYTRAGLDVSPAVAQYLGMDENRRNIMSWRFVDDEDVPPGAWLKYDEQAVIYTALHQLKNSNPGDLPIQKASEPIDDPDNIDANKKTVNASKG